MRLSCNFVNVYYTSLSCTVHLRIPLEESLACPTRGERSYCCDGSGKMAIHGMTASALLARLFALTSRLPFNLYIVVTANH